MAYSRHKSDLSGESCCFRTNKNEQLVRCLFHRYLWCDPTGPRGGLLDADRYPDVR